MDQNHLKWFPDHWRCFRIFCLTWNLAACAISLTGRRCTAKPLQISVILKMLQPPLVTVQLFPVNNEMCPLLTADMLPLLLQAAAEGRKWSGGGGGWVGVCVWGWGGGHNTPICDDPGWRGAVAAPVLRGSATDGGASCLVLQS